MHDRELFLRHIAQTSPSPLAFEIERAEGAMLYDKKGKEYIDLIGGISVANTGHRHPKVIDAIKQQLEKYLHVMVYGEFVETPQVHYAKYLTERLPSGLNSVYFTNSGAEAVEGAMKLAKRVTGRSKIIAFNKAYHGSTQGALSIIGDEGMRNSFRPLLPGIVHVDINSNEALELITNDVACVIIETVQGEAGVIVPNENWIHALREKCTMHETLFVLDEIQTGFGRTGKLWAFEHSNIIPDILLLGKALGGGLPLGAFIASKELMQYLTHDPVLGHITTFGGHPLSCAAGLAATKVLIDEGLLDTVKQKEKQFLGLLKHTSIRSVRSSGLLIAVDFGDEQTCKKVVDHCINNGVFTDWFLFAPQCLRICPPLNIDDRHVEKACAVINSF